MGNCNKKDQNLTVTNFEEQRWRMFPSSLHPSCAILQNLYHPNLRLMKWLGPICRQPQSTDWPQGSPIAYLPIIYEVGQTRKYCGEIFDRKGQGQSILNKKQYLITQELVRVKDIQLTQEQIIIILHEALLGYQNLLSRFGGFVAREDMIFISRDGVVKMWVNENLAENQPQFPHPYISQEQFISSLIRQICTHASGFQSLMEHLLSQNINFPRIQDCLTSMIHMRRSKLKVDIDKNLFDQIIKGYKVLDRDAFRKSRARSSMAWNGTDSNGEKRNNQQLQFIVGGQIHPNSHKKIAYVRDYSRIKVPFSNENKNDNNNEVVNNGQNLRQSKSSNNLRNGIKQVESKVVIYGNRMRVPNTYVQQ